MAADCAAEVTMATSAGQHIWVTCVTQFSDSPESTTRLQVHRIYFYLNTFFEPQQKINRVQPKRQNQRKHRCEPKNKLYINNIHQSIINQ